jgi:hypothetical protein
VLCCSVSVFRPSTGGRPRNRAARGSGLQRAPRRPPGKADWLRAKERTDAEGSHAKKDLKMPGDWLLWLRIERLPVSKLNRAGTERQRSASRSSGCGSGEKRVFRLEVRHPQANGGSLRLCQRRHSPACARSRSNKGRSPTPPAIGLSRLTYGRESAAESRGLGETGTKPQGSSRSTDGQRSDSNSQRSQVGHVRRRRAAKVGRSGDNPIITYIDRSALTRINSNRSFCYWIVTNQQSK